MIFLVIWDDIPSDLPPISGVEYEIDFVPRATIPNRSGEKSHPGETKELQRQVGDMLKGYIRERMSSCAISMFFVPKKTKYGEYVWIVNLSITSL